VKKIFFLDPKLIDAAWYLRNLSKNLFRQGDTTGHFVCIVYSHATQNRKINRKINHI